MSRTINNQQPSAAELLRAGVWSVPQVALMLDTPESVVARWCALRLIPGATHKGGEWRIPGPGLSFFQKGAIEPMYSPETVAALLDQSPATVRNWLKAGRMRKVKLGTARGSPVRIKESELRRFIAA